MRNQAIKSVATAVLVLSAVSRAKKDSGGSSARIPMVEPPVTKATPAGLKSATASSATSARIGHTMSLDYSEIQSRFFSTGPTTIKTLLQTVDTRLAEINTRSTESTHDCLSATAVEQTISVMGSSEKVYFQCYDVFGDGTGGMLFGKKNDTWYIYQNVGAGRSLAKVMPVSGSSGEYTVEAWFSVGQNNTSGCSSTWYGCSYGVVHLKANSSTKLIEMTVAGTGFGYCGAHLKSDETNLFITGSASGGTSDGTTWSCAETDTSCSLASDLTQTGSCASVDGASFELTSLGVTDHSTLGTGITLDGTSTDHVHFGPSVTELSAITGVAKF